MKFLLDINAILAAIIEAHPHHPRAETWMQNKQLALCPLSELGFLRISTHHKAFNFAMPIAQKALRDFIDKAGTEFIIADLSAVGLKAPKSEAVTDIYLADLAARHQMRLATFDARIKHASVELIP